MSSSPNPPRLARIARGDTPVPDDGGVRERAERRRRREAWDARRYRSALVPIIREVLAALDARADDGAPLPPDVLDRILRRHPRDGAGLFSRSELIEGCRALAREEAFAADVERFARGVRRKRVRTLSGVAPVTVFTPPFPCPGRCVFCPNDVRMPKSYLAAEPGAQRAADHGFDPYRQTWSRLAAFRATGHATDKVEVIVLGGTWSSHPDAYRRGFVARVFDAISDFGEGIDRRAAAAANGAAEPSLPLDDAAAWGALGTGRYNRAVRARARRRAAAGEGAVASWDDVAAAHARNESAPARCVGLSFETRPDLVTPDEIRRLRRLGATKVQLGVQSLDDDVLRASARGHDVATTHRAIALLRAAGFKIQLHWMPNLPGATAASDARDAGRLFADPRVRPDELKVYPCVLVESAELAALYARGAWHPYERDDLVEVLVAALASAPRWCRVTRVIRDISSDDIAAGNKETNLRETAERELARRGLRASDIRAREVRGERVDAAELRALETRYATSTGDEVFLELVDERDAIAGFLRLHLPSAEAPAPEELVGSAVVRELHVYGEAQPLGRVAPTAVQHRGLGGRLLERAAALARESGYGSLAVISAVGTRAYYRARGFADGALYQHRSLSA